MITTGIPGSNQALRESIYRGAIHRVPASSASLALIRHTLSLIELEFGKGTELRQAQFSIDAGEHYERVSRVRKRLTSEEECVSLLLQLLEEQGFDLKEHAVDVARLRAVLSGGHENPLALPAYVAHRDTWYANPEAQINFWVPLHDVSAADSFAFFPAYFDQAVENDSDGFDYDRFMETAGWQKGTGAQVVRPGAAEGAFSRAGGSAFPAAAGDIIIFSASQLHETVKNVSGLTRFSLDFRTVHLSDHHSGKGAPNVDNRSTGCSVKDYRQPR